MLSGGDHDSEARRSPVSSEVVKAFEIADEHLAEMGQKILILIKHLIALPLITKNTSVTSSKSGRGETESAEVEEWE